MAINAALSDVEHREIGTVPSHLRDSHYSGAKELNHGQGYLYAHDYPHHYVEQQYLPDALLGSSYYHPTQEGYEKEIKRLMVERKGSI